MRGKIFWWQIFRWLILLDMLMSLDVWFLWGVNKIVFSGIVTIYCVCFSIFNQHFFRLQNNGLMFSFVFIFLAYLLTRPSRNMIGWVGVIMNFIPMLFVVFLTKERAQDFFAFFKRVLYYLLLFSLAGWGLYLLNFPLPHTRVSFGNIDGFARYYFDNYYVFLLDYKYVHALILPRFMSVFTEPGFLGCILSILLFSEGFVIKKNLQNVVFLVALFFSLSLAGWLISIVGFMFLKLKPTVHSFIVIGLVVIGVSFASLFSREYNGGNNFLNNYIFQRLELDASSGNIQGYNRSSLDTREYFSFFIHSDKLLFGEGVGSLADENVDWKSFMIRYGLIPTLLVLFYYLWPTLRIHSHKYYLFGISLIFLLIASQTTYGIFSCMYISLFMLSVKNVDNLHQLVTTNQK